MVWLRSRGEFLPMYSSCNEFGIDYCTANSSSLSAITLHLSLIYSCRQICSYFRLLHNHCPAPFGEQGLPPDYHTRQLLVHSFELSLSLSCNSKVNRLADSFCKRGHSCCGGGSVSFPFFLWVPGNNKVCPMQNSLPIS